MNKEPNVWMISGPNIPKNRGGPNHNYLSRFGKIKHLVSIGEYPSYNARRVTENIDERLDEFDPEIDFIVWGGGDPASSLLVGSCLLNRGIKEINYLRFDRDTDASGKRDRWNGTYVPIKLKLTVEEYNK